MPSQQSNDTPARTKRSAHSPAHQQRKIQLTIPITTPPPPTALLRTPQNGLIPSLRVCAEVRALVALPGGVGAGAALVVVVRGVVAEAVAQALPVERAAEVGVGAGRVDGGEAAVGVVAGLRGGGAREGGEEEEGEEDPEGRHRWCCSV